MPYCLPKTSLLFILSFFLPLQAAAWTIGGEKTKFVDINPKSIIPEELYGYITMATREWKDGLLSKTMRDLGVVPDTLPKWIILDGDLDANWIESMNSVMDDNRMLTLASNERIPLKMPYMRMIFEIRDLNYASPATVSRAGMIYISSDKGTQWRSLLRSWVKTYKEAEMPWPETLCNVMHQLFDKYVADVLFEIKKGLVSLVPTEELSTVKGLLYLLESMITEELVVKFKKEKTSEADILKYMETVFVFCAVWAFGCSLSLKDGIDYRSQFDEYWRGTWKSVKFPSRMSVFESYLNPETHEFEPWSNSPYFFSIDYDSTWTYDTVLTWVMRDEFCRNMYTLNLNTGTTYIESPWVLSCCITPV